MSHFSVLVIGDDVSGQLAPYQENNMGDCPEQYLKFRDTEDEYRKEYETESTEMVELLDGQYVHTWDERFRVEGSFGIGTNSHKVPEHLKKVDVPHRQRFATFEAFCKEWHGDKRDPKTNRYGYWHNPDSKWDWYQIGGRYSGRLKLKPGAAGQKGGRSWTNENDQILNEFVDSARFGDIDWEGMRKHRLAERAKRWEEAQADGDKSEFIQRYKYGIEPGMTREQYIAQGEEFSVFAVVKDGKWYQKGEMGWWGIVTDEKDGAKWKTELKDLLEGLPADTLMTIVDCHV